MNVRIVAGKVFVCVIGKLALEKRIISDWGVVFVSKIVNFFIK